MFITAVFLSAVCTVWKLLVANCLRIGSMPICAVDARAHRWEGFVNDGRRVDAVDERGWLTILKKMLEALLYT